MKSHHDTRVPTEWGNLFVRVWQPKIVRSTVPIVLFHDSLGCVELWKTFPSVLAQCTGRQVIAYDRLGFGQSDTRLEALDWHFIEDEAKTYFPHARNPFGFDRFVAFGHSVGGAMATHCAAQYGSACEALITESAQAFVEDKTLSGIIAAKQSFKQSESFERLHRYHGSKTQWVLDAWINTWMSPNFSTWSLDAAAQAVQCPALIIHGEDDEYGSQQHPNRIASFIKTSTHIELMPRTRHVPHREHELYVTQRVAQYLLSFV